MEYFLKETGHGCMCAICYRYIKGIMKVCYMKRYAKGILTGTLKVLSDGFSKVY